MIRSAIVLVAVVIGASSAPTMAAEDLAATFGFDSLEVIKVGRRAGPVSVADVNGDGLNDIVVVNNFASRIEVHYQKPSATPDDVVSPTRPNVFPEHWRFRRQEISVNHRVASVVPFDVDSDGLMDFMYAGFPAELVYLRQTDPGEFEVARRHRAKNLSSSRDGLAIADVLGDPAPEIIMIRDGSIEIRALGVDSLGTPVELTAGDPIVAFVIDDFDGNGRPDIAGVLPDDPAPVRIWFGELEESRGVIGAQMRFEMPPIVEASAVHRPGEDAACLAVIERASKRIIIYHITNEPIEHEGDRDAALRIRGFTDAGNRTRRHAVVDVDGDGLTDLVATDTEANALVVFRQRAGRGFQAPETFPTLSQVTALVAGNVDGDNAAELFVLSEDESVVGRCDVSGGAIPFPQPVQISAGHTPTALNLVELEDGPRIAIVAKEGRSHFLDLVSMDGETTTIDLGKLSRSPETIVALDADQNGRTDLLLFTREKPMTMLTAGDEGFTVTESKDMGQYGLVKAALAENIAIFDIDGDGLEELLIADQNYVRAVRYEPEPEGNISPGWQVVTQVNARDATSKLVSLAVLGNRIIAADKENDRLIVMGERSDTSGRRMWEEIESLTVRGFDFNAIHAGDFAGTGRLSLIAVGDDGFAVVRLDGDRVALRDVATWRSTEEDHLPHEFAQGDLNGDGFNDLVTLDAGEQMCDIFTFTQLGRLLYATGFTVFESRLFTGGDAREFEPSQAIITDLTGDGGSDLLLLTHDRLLLYPMTQRP